MAVRPKTERVPRTRAGGEWTEAGYWGFIRNHLRLMSRRWPPRKQVLLTNRREYRGKSKQQKWEYQCQKCGQWYQAKEINVDHVTPAGQLLSYDDIGPFVERLLCEADGLQVLCKTCHKRKTNAIPTS